MIITLKVYNPYQQALQAQGFDFTYDKTLYDKLGDGNLDNIRGYITGMPLSFHQHSAHCMIKNLKDALFDVDENPF
jgi:hypothetical protein